LRFIPDETLFLKHKKGGEPDEFTAFFVFASNIPHSAIPAFSKVAHAGQQIEEDK